jgi:hypothetical protein
MRFAGDARRRRRGPFPYTERGVFLGLTLLGGPTYAQVRLLEVAATLLLRFLKDARPRWLFFAPVQLE